LDLAMLRESLGADLALAGTQLHLVLELLHNAVTVLSEN
jgi:hypothetical protein